ncbi:MAG: DNA translocase FtsK 4TM domain-containing protein, partial [Solirubrobacteraceae bacterium]
MPTTRKRSKPSARRRKPVRRTASRRSSRARRARRTSRDLLPRLPVLDQRQREALALGLIALGVYMGFILWGGWDGGQIGSGLSRALGFAVGGVRILVPAALVLGGTTMIAREAFPALRPLRTGGICLFGALTLALAAGTLGISSAPSGHEVGQWHAAYLEAHGGLIGQALYWATSRLVQQIGVSILVVFLFLVGVTLLTGASLAAVVTATGSGLRDTTRMLSQRRSGDSHPRVPQRPVESLQPPDPLPSELIVRATHVEAPSVDGAPPALDPWAAEAEPVEAQVAHEENADATEEEEGAFAAVDLRAANEPDQVGEHTATEPLDEALLTPQGRLRDAVTDDPDFEWELPGAERILTRSTAEQARPDTAGQERTATSLIEALGHFGVQAKVIGTVAGPHITRYELRLAPGTKVGKVAQLKDDLAYALAATDIRILAPIPGKQAVGVEVPNAKRRMVRLGDVFQEPPKDWSPLTVWLGKDVAGKAIGADLAKMPHLLVAGTTGAGKSGAINAMLCSVLLRATPHELRLVLVDPKQVELNHSESIPHLLTPVITSPRMAANALQNLVREMEQRYGIMSLSRTRSLIELNKAREARGEAPLPYILCVIDELADLMMVAPADVEDSIIRLAQKARAVGIHLVLATQSPRVDVITGMIKANVPSRIAFSVSSQTDSRVILDQNGAESLLGQGDMLFKPLGTSRLQRVQGAYVSEEEIALVVEQTRQREQELDESYLELPEVFADPADSADHGDFDPDDDPLLDKAIEIV